MSEPPLQSLPEPLPKPLPEPVKLLAGILHADRAVLSAALDRMRDLWGPTDFEGPDHPFDLTDYYEREMGTGLERRLVSFHTLIPPEGIVERKLEAMAIEDAFRGPSGRIVNIDVGYLDFHKLVLASVKSGALKVYLGRGVWGDVVCRYSRGRFQAFEWSFADFRDGRHDEELLAIRGLYKAQLTGWGG